MGSIPNHSLLAGASALNRYYKYEYYRLAKSSGGCEVYMNRIRIELDTSGIVSSAEKGRQAIASITGEIKKAREEGRKEDAEILSYEKKRLQRRATGFDRDIKALANDPHVQTQTAAGATVLKLDPEYENAIKSHAATIEKLTDKLQGAIISGSVEKIREITPQIEKQQSAFHKTVKDITYGNFPKEPPVDSAKDNFPKEPPVDSVKDNFPKEPPNENNTPGQKNQSIPLPKNEDWRELKGLSGAISQEHDVKNWEQVSRLGNAKDTLRGIMGEYDRDSKLEAKLKADPELASQLKEIRDALKGTIVALNDAAANEDYKKVEQLTGQAKQLQGLSHKTITEATAPPQPKAAKDGMSSFLNVQTAQQIVGAVTNSINTYVAHLDRSGIVNAMGSGDPMGARIEELHRSAKEKSNLWGTVGKIGGGILGTVAGLALAPITGGASLLGTGAMAAAGAALGSTVLGAAGELTGTLGDEKKANKMATGESYAKFWERQAPEGMELTATLGKYGKSPEENTRIMRHTWENAANTATEYGFDTSEGIEQVKAAAYQGLNEMDSLKSARDVFAFERGTGADRGTLSGVNNTMARYGVSGALQTAWQGNQASGMAPAQFSEYLRSMQKTFDDGISKGFVRGAGEIAGNFAFLSDLNGGSELWKGEQGANRLATMNAGLAATTGLSSASDILAFQGAKNLLDQWSPEMWNEKVGDLDTKTEGVELRRGYDYIDTMAILERGLTPDLFHSQMQMFEKVEGEGNRTGIVEQMKNVYGLNYTGAGALYQSYNDEKERIRRENSGLGESGIAKKIDEFFSGDTWKKNVESFQNSPDYMTKELEQLSYIKDIQKYTTQMGQIKFDNRFVEIIAALKKSYAEAKKNGVTSDTGPGEPAPPTPVPPVKPLVPVEPTPLIKAAPTSDEEAALAKESFEAGDYEKSEGHLLRSQSLRAKEDQEDRERLQSEVDYADWIRKNLIKPKLPLGIGDRATFFTGDGKIGAGEDEIAKERLMAFSDPGAGKEANDAFLTAVRILQQFPEDARRTVDEKNLINDKIPERSVEGANEKLIGAILELAKAMNVEIEYK